MQLPRTTFPLYQIVRVSAFCKFPGLHVQLRQSRWLFMRLLKSPQLHDMRTLQTLMLSQYHSYATAAGFS
jgi:hypothetical protein